MRRRAFGVSGFKGLKGLGSGRRASWLGVVGLRGSRSQGVLGLQAYLKQQYTKQYEIEMQKYLVVDLLHSLDPRGT